MFRRIAIVNRGEAAMRLIHAVRDLSAQTGKVTETVALYTDADVGASFVREADRRVFLGAAADRPYLDLAVLERALAESGADAAWPGWGFVAEDPAFAELCEKAGVTFVGPSAEAMRNLGDKIGAKLIAERVGVPVAPWSRGPVATLEEAHRAAERIGYPLMLKATAGGGGRGIRVITSAADLTEALERTSAEALRAFGNGTVFLERLVTGARHVEVQVIADGQGTAWALGVRDCSVQRRNQKVIEESASPLLSAQQVTDLKAAAERLVLSVGYRGAATVESLYHPDDKQFAFLEVNTRLQVEHPVTELTTGVDLVRMQLHVACGGRLVGDRPAESGHAVEARLNAEDPDRDFAPAPGRIARLVLPAGPGIRVDTGVSEGDTIPADFDSMIAKVIAYGRDRDEALARLRRAMAETSVVIEGGATNKSFVLDLLDQPEVTDGSPGAGWADTGWIDRVRAQGRLAAREHSGVALVAAAVRACEDEEAAGRQALLAAARGGRPHVRHDPGQAVDYKLRDVSYRVRVARRGPDRFRVEIRAGGDAAVADAVFERFDGYSGALTVNGQRFRLTTSVHGPVHLVEVDGVAHRVSRDEGGVVRSPAPALVVATPVAAGDEVAEGAPVLVLESMKMETVLRAPFRALVRECAVPIGTQVETGAPLLRLEPLPDEDGAPDDGSAATAATLGEQAVGLPARADDGSAEELAGACLRDLRGLLLGFDGDADDRTALLVRYLDARAELGDELLPAELDLLTVFADLSELSRSRPVRHAGEADSDPATTGPASAVHSPREHFHVYLRSLDADRAGLPEAARAVLHRVLAHYGVTGPDRTPELETAVFRIYLAQQRLADSAGIVCELLRRWQAGALPAEPVRARAGQALDRLVEAARDQFPAVSDLARGAVFRWFTRPPLLRDRARVYAAVRADLRHLDAHPAAADRADRIRAMAVAPESLVRLLGQRLTRSAHLASAGRPGLDHAPLLEVLTRRRYGDHRLTNVTVADAPGHRFVTAEHVGTPAGAVTRVAATTTDLAGLSDAVAATGALAGRTPGGGLAADIHLAWPGRAATDELAEAVTSAVTARPAPPGVVRITVTVAATAAGVLSQHFTFRPGDDRPAEDRQVRGLHPRLAERLRLGRFREFGLTRLPSTDEDLYLLRAVAKTDAKDERLIAMGQVRKLTPQRDADGRLVALPEVENTLAACLDALRTARSRQPGGGGTGTNRILMYVWPPGDVSAPELARLVRRLRPSVSGVGLEEVELVVRQRQATGEPAEMSLRITGDTQGAPVLHAGTPPTDVIPPLDDYRRKVLSAARRGAVYPYELTGLLAGDKGTFTEYDLEPGEPGSAVGPDAGRRCLVPVDRPKGRNTAGIVVGVVTTPTAVYPEGITRVALLGDPTKSLGALSEPECARVIAALDLAEELRVPIEWIAISAGAQISMASGSENMDWVAAALKRIVEFTQAGGEINIVIAGITVGGQPYWNAEATMLMHTKGILVMTPDSAMVLTGKQSLDFSGGVSAEDNFGIGGHDRIMGPNGQAQYWAPNLTAAAALLMTHYDHAYVVPGEKAPRPAPTTDPADRDIRGYPHPADGSDFATVGEIFSDASNPDRKKPFDIRTVMRAVVDQDHPVLERWAGMADAETSVVQDAHIGGRPVCLLGVESHAVPRQGFPPADGPDTYTAGTLFPMSSKKTARAINAASGNRPLVVLANMSGFDGSPESMRKLQLEYGAEIGRAVVNFEGPIVFCVVSRCHGGTFAVFSKALNPDMTILAVEGSYASVLGGAPAAAVVFSGEVRKRTAADHRVADLRAKAAGAVAADHAALTIELAEVTEAVRAEKLSEVAAEFDGIHTIQRAVEVGSVDRIISAAQLRPAIIDAIETGLRRETAARVTSGDRDAEPATSYGRW